MLVLTFPGQPTSLQFGSLSVQDPHLCVFSYEPVPFREYLGDGGQGKPQFLPWPEVCSTSPTQTLTFSMKGMAFPVTLAVRFRPCPGQQLQPSGC